MALQKFVQINKMTLARVSAAFSDVTTVHGVKDVFHSESRPLRIFWAFLMVAAVGATGYFAYGIVDEFSKHPVITSYKLAGALTSLPMPKVQVCLSNFVDMRRILQLGIHENTYLGIFDATLMTSFSTVKLTRTAVVRQLEMDCRREKTHRNHIERHEFCAQEADNKLAEYRNSVWYWSPDILDPLLGSPGDNEFFNEHFKIGLRQVFFPNASATDDVFAMHGERMKPFTRQIGDTKPTIAPDLLLKAIAFDAEEVLIGCYFGTTILNCSNVSRTVQVMEGAQLCYEIDVNRNQTVGGSGLTVIVNTNRRHRYGGIWAMHGIIGAGGGGIWVRIGKEDPSTTNDRVLMAAGRSVLWSLHPMHYKLTESKAYETCVDDVPRYFLAQPYSDTICRGDCLFETSNRLCNCSMYVNSEAIVPRSGYKPCLYFEDITCLKTNWDSFVDDNFYKKCIQRCKPACDYWEYGTTVSYADFPFNEAKKLLYPFDDDIQNAETEPDEHIRINIAFNNLQVTEVRQVPAMTLESLVGQVGGQLGLFMGASILSLVHAIVFFCSHCCLALTVKKGHFVDGTPKRSTLASTTAANNNRVAREPVSTAITIDS